MALFSNVFSLLQQFSFHQEVNMDRPSVRQRLASVLIGWLLLLFSSCNAAPSTPASAPSPKALVAFKVPGFSLDSTAWSPDGKRIASVVYSLSYTRSVYQVRVWDAKTGNTLSILPFNGSGSSPYALLWSPNGTDVGVNLKNGSNELTPLVVWNIVTGKQIGGIPRASRFAWSPDSTRLALFTDRVQVFDIRTGNVLWSGFSGYEHESSAFYSHRSEFGTNDPEGNCQSPQNGLAWSPDGSRIAAATTGYSYTANMPVVVVGNAATGRLLSVHPGDCLTWLPDSRRIFSPLYAGNQVWDSTTGKTLSTISSTTVSDGTYSGYFNGSISPDGHSIFEDINLEYFQIWSTTTGRPVMRASTNQGGDGCPTLLSLETWSPESHRIALRRYLIHFLFARAGCNTVQVWDVVHGNLIALYKGASTTSAIVSSWLEPLSWSPDGHLLLSVGGDVAEVWQP